MLRGLCGPDNNHQFMGSLYNVGTPFLQINKKPLELNEVVGYLADDISKSKKLRCGVPCFRYRCIIVIAGSN